jgi:hypothetical protein
MCHDSFILSCIASILLINEEGRTEPVVGLSDTLLRISNISVYFSKTICCSNQLLSVGRYHGLYDHSTYTYKYEYIRRVRQILALTTSQFLSPRIFLHRINSALSTPLELHRNALLTIT